MKQELQQLEARAKEAKILYGWGQISYEEAEERIRPYITVVNTRGAEIAKEHQMPFVKLTLAKFLR